MTLATFKKKAKSFYWASLLLPRKELAHAGELYNFCRKMDDAIDDHQDAREVSRIIKALENREEISISNIINRYHINTAVVIAFLEALVEDLSPVKHHSMRSLIRYCYGVAGSVGIMMSNVLGCCDPSVIYYAIDLGIAMQLTNIARDRADDHRNKKEYFPLGSDQRTTVLLAEKYYRSGIQGIYLLPRNIRPGIMTAAYLYRAIGRKTLRNPALAYHNRTVINLFHKVFLTLCSLIACLRKPSVQKHDASLHKYLDNLPETHMPPL